MRVASKCPSRSQTRYRPFSSAKYSVGGSVSKRPKGFGSFVSGRFRRESRCASSQRSTKLDMIDQFLFFRLDFSEDILASFPVALLEDAQVTPPHGLVVTVRRGRREDQKSDFVSNVFDRFDPFLVDHNSFINTLITASTARFHPSY